MGIPAPFHAAAPANGNGLKEEGNSFRKREARVEIPFSGMAPPPQPFRPLQRHLALPEQEIMLPEPIGLGGVPPAGGVEHLFEQPAQWVPRQ